MTDINFFEKDDPETGAEAIRNKVTNLVRLHTANAIDLAQAEDKLRELKVHRDELELKLIPDALLEAGLSEIVTVDGIKVGTTVYVGAIPAENKPRAFQWMDDNGFSSIIKRQVSLSFDKGSTKAAEEAVEAIKALGLEPRQSLDVHFQTFKAFAKEQTIKGRPLPLDDWGVYYGTKATIKRV